MPYLGPVQLAKECLDVGLYTDRCDELRRFYVGDLGFRYLTVQVWDARREHAHLLDTGWRELTAPVRLGDTAFISFVIDPDGTPIEISQRASLTGPLPDADAP